MMPPKSPKIVSSHSPSVPTDYLLRGQTLTLLPERALFWQEKRYLLLADSHLGKAGHFRKHGAPIPRAIHDRDLSILSALVQRWSPAALVVLGDLFHSTLNNEWQEVEQWLQQHSALPVVLVKGNHDILPEAVYAHPNLTVYPDTWEEGPFCLTHQPLVEPVLRPGGLAFPLSQIPAPALYNLAGHVHPGVRVSIGMGQRVKLPCFYFTSHVGLLPAFGQFTGCATMQQGRGNRVFAVIEGKRVVPVGAART